MFESLYVFLLYLHYLTVPQRLLKACREGDIRKVRRLLLGGSDPNQADEVLSYCNLHMVYTNTDKQKPVGLIALIYINKILARYHINYIWPWLLYAITLLSRHYAKGQ